VVGTLSKEPETGTYYVEPEEERLLFNLIIPEEQLGGAALGQLVRAAVTHYPTAHLNPTGAVVESLGEADDAAVQTRVVIAKHELADEFSPEVLAEAEALPRSLPPEALNGRLDLRELPLVTIDGEDARDFDDGVAVIKKPGGAFTLYVAIADVSFYVSPDSLMDQEAYRRGTSVYFPQRAVHMLPSEVATGICSLKPEVDRLAVCAIIDYDRRGRRKGYRFSRAVIRSQARLTYRGVQAVLDGDKDRRRQYRPLVKMLERLGELCLLLRERRGERGSLLMSIPEAEVILDERGWPETIGRLDHLLSHQIIEEFMIAANEAVAEFLGEPSIFRVHDRPDAVKMEAFRSFVRSLGFVLPREANRNPRALRDFLEEVQDSPYSAMVQLMLLRSLKQASYTAANLGHYGLACEFYTHFTSPIRRYPDLLVHRLLLARLAKKKPSLDPDELEEQARHLSRRERVGIEAEREMLARMQVRCLAQRLGETFSGRITGVTAFGFFVSLDEIYADGLVRLVDLPDDYYRFDESRQRLVGRRHRRIFQLGDQVIVTVSQVDIKRRHVSLVLAGEAEAPTEPAGLEAEKRRFPRKRGKGREDDRPEKN